MSDSEKNEAFNENDPWSEGRDLDPRGLFKRYGDCVVRVEITLANGDLANGTAFHVGGGAYVTAKHVIEEAASIRLFERESWVPEDKGHSVTDVLKHESEKIDLAIILSDLRRDRFADHGMKDLPPNEAYDFIPLPELWGEWIDDQFVLTKAMICGFPRVPFANKAIKVTVSAEINAQFDRYDKSNVHFIVSSIARGGFSGAPLISQFDFLLGVVTESLSENNDTPYMAVLATEPLFEIIDKNEAKLSGRLEHYLASWSKAQRDKRSSAEK